MGLFMNEMDIDEAVEHYHGGRRAWAIDAPPHPIRARAARLLAAYRDVINRHSDGWPYFGSEIATGLMELVQGTAEPTESNLLRAQRRIIGFCSRRGLPQPVDPFEAQALSLFAS